MPKAPFTKLVIGGGGAKGVGMLGSLYYAYEGGMLSGIDEYWGTSIGSILATMLMIGYTPYEMFKIFFIQDTFIDIFSQPINVLELYSLCPIHMLGSRVSEFIKLKAPDTDFTFFDLWKRFEKKIHIISANVSTMKAESFSVDTHPYMSIVDAIEASCDIPGIFTSKIYNGVKYADGGLVNNFPIDLADNGRDHVLGICSIPKFDPNTEDINFINWYYRLFHFPLIELHNMRMKKISHRSTVIELHLPFVNTIELSPNKQTKLEMFTSGYKQASEIIKEELEWRDDFQNRINAACLG